VARRSVPPNFLGQRPHILNQLLLITLFHYTGLPGCGQKRKFSQK
jgi:hypothetical protein